MKTCERAVLKREEHRAASGASKDDVDTLLDALARIAEPVRVSYLWRPMLADPGDELVLEAAVSGRAALIAGFNLRHLKAAADAFGIEVAPPGEVVKRLEGRVP